MTLVIAAKFEVRGLIVETIAIAVVYFLARPQVAAQHDRHDGAVHIRSPVFADGNAAICTILIEARMFLEDLPGVLSAIKASVALAHAAKDSPLSGGGSDAGFPPQTGQLHGLLPASPGAMHATDDSWPACVGDGRCASYNSSFHSSTGAT